MSSEPPVTGLDRLAALLADLGLVEPGPVELAELLWLAARSGEGGPSAELGSSHDTGRSDGGSSGTGPEHGTGEGTGRAEDESLRTALHLPSDDPADGMAAAPVPAPSAPMLTRPLSLQRALRPLKRQVPDPKRSLLDENATANRLAEVLRRPGPVRWLPVLRPSTERWLDLHLVIDCGPTMAVWRPLALELRTLLLQTGAFRQVNLSRLGGTGGLTGHRAVDARTVVLVLSDCMGPQWRPGAAGARWHRTLHALARRSPVAVVQPLPERLWPLAALPAAAGVLSAPEAGVPNSAYGFAPFTENPPGPGELPVPLLEPSAGWLANWARLVGSPAGGQVVGSALLVGPAPVGLGAEAETGPEPAELAPEELVLRFRSVASPEAFTLAGLTALTTPALPVMRLLQRAGFARPKPQHLAEVVVSGLLKEREGRRDRFEFRSGVRELLLHTLPRSTTHQAVGLLARVGEQIAARAGRVPNEIAAMASMSGDGFTASVEPHAFALVSPAALRMLDGPAAAALRPVPQPGTRPVPVPAQAPAPALPVPARSRAVLLLTTSRLYVGDPSSEVDRSAERDLDGLAEALADPVLVGLGPDRVWVGTDDPYGFLRALRTAAAEAEDTLIVFVGGTVSSPPEGALALGSVPPENRELSWASVLSVVEGSRARQRLLMFDGVWPGSDAVAPEIQVGDSGVYQIVSLRPRVEPSFAGRIGTAIRTGRSDGPKELTIDQILELIPESAEARVWDVAEPGASFPLTRNAALGTMSPTGSGRSQSIRRVVLPTHAAGLPRPEADAAATNAPYFFLSHAPGAQAVDRLFNDLSEEVLELTDLPAGVPAGLMDLGGELDPAGEARLSEALASCRVFVPLYSPGYFRTERCGRHWSAFAQRPGPTGRSTAFVPVLWTPVGGAELPDVARMFQFIDSTFGPEYAVRGLHGLLRSQRSQYELVVHRLATRIVDVARATRMAPARPLPWSGLDNAFATSPPRDG